MAKEDTNLDDVKFEIKWEGKPSGLLERFLTLIHLNFTDYQITKDELIIKRGFFDELTIRFINENLYPEIIVKNGKIFVRYEMSGAFEPRLSDKTNGYETLYKYYLALKCLSDSYYLVLKYFQNE